VKQDGWLERHPIRTLAPDEEVAPEELEPCPQCGALVCCEACARRFDALAWGLGMAKQEGLDL